MPDLTRAEVAYLSARHRPAPQPAGDPRCVACADPWPCDIGRLATALLKVWAERDMVWEALSNALPVPQAWRKGYHPGGLDLRRRGHKANVAERRATWRHP